MKKHIFISYRRSDARADARNVFQRLQRDFGSGRPFMDVDSIAKGRDFKTVLDEALNGTAVMLVLIGKTWLDVRTGTGLRRLDDTSDFVHMEIAYALKRGLPVIPVLLDGTPLPAADELPDELQPLADRQSSRLMHDNFPRDMDGLSDAIARYVPRSRRRVYVAIAALLAVVAIVGVARLTSPQRTDTVVLDKAAFIELLKAYQKPEGQPGASTEANERLLSLVNAKINDSDSSYAEFIKRTNDLLGKLDKLRSLLSSPFIAEAKAQSQVGDFRKAKSALRELLAKARSGGAEPSVVAEFGESLARAFAAVGDLSQAIETYSETVAVVSPSGRLIRGYVEALLAAGQFSTAVAAAEAAIAPSKVQSLSPPDVAWINGALGQAFESQGQLSVAQDKYTIAYQTMRDAERAGQAQPADVAAILNDMTSVSLRRSDMRTARVSLCESIRLSIDAKGSKDRSTLFPRLNLVGLSRQMGLIGAARHQLDEVTADIDGGLPADDPLRGLATIHAALLAIADNSNDAGLQSITEAQRFFEKLAGKGQGYQQRTARIEQIKSIALFNLGRAAEAYESASISKDLNRRAFGRLSAEELTSSFWLARATIALNRLPEAEAHYKSIRAGTPTFEKEIGPLTLQANLLEAELLLVSGGTDAGQAMLEKVISALFEIEGRGDAYLTLTDDAIKLLLMSKKQDVNTVTLYRQGLGQRTLLRFGKGSTC